MKKTGAVMCEYKCEVMNEKFVNVTPRYCRAVRAEKQVYVNSGKEMQGKENYFYFGQINRFSVNL